MWTEEQTGWLRSPQRYERIAARLAADVRSGLLAPGERLPGERELARRLEVSRSSVREALAALALEEVLETRPGSGTYVTVDAPTKVRTLADLAQPFTAKDLAGDASPSALLEARLAIEPELAALAAGHAHRDDAVEAILDRMEALDAVTSPEERAAWNDADRSFHLQLARMTQNVVLASLAEHVAALMDQPLWQSLRDESVAASGRLAMHQAEHRMIYEAVVAGDAAAARFLTRQHIQRVRRYMTLDEREDPR